MLSTTFNIISVNGMS